MASNSPNPRRHHPPPRANISKRFRPTCREFQPNAPRPEQYRSPRFRPAQENIRANAPRPAHIRTPPFKGLPGGNSGPFVRIFNQMRRGPRIFAPPPFSGLDAHRGLPLISAFQTDFSGGISLKILGMDHIAISVRDLAEAEDFYTRILGGTIERRI